ncbi:hypothetical protein DGMP_18380 [Desulfomarina profundi]|uniref:Uncharacterized protein n=1 Tax=Desulfomarina profundi TaxID=2772557 RepID=A0A8D5JPC8_9BACT|nr:hypothetical protein DGMP_18380 [Desulfomarina profundi]
MGWRRRAGTGSVLCGKYHFELTWGQVASAAIQCGANNIPDHVSQKTVTGKFQQDLFFPLVK